MDAIDLLLHRRSEKKLSAPAPQGEQLNTILQAALRAPDHGKLQPYRFTVIQGEGLITLSELLKNAVEELALGDERIKKAESFANRAPMIIAVVAKLDPHIKKVPAWEQMLCAGCATYAMQLAANAQGFANVWVTGPWLEGTALRQALHCENNDKIIALLMLGTAAEKAERVHKATELENFVTFL